MRAMSSQLSINACSVFPDINECEKNPCPAGSKCVNTHGSFSCECPLGFDLEDGRTCTLGKSLYIYKDFIIISQIQVIAQIKFTQSDLLFPSLAKTFLGTFSVTRLPHDHVTFKTESQREIMQLVRVSPHHCIVHVWVYVYYI